MATIAIDLPDEWAAGLVGEPAEVARLLAIGRVASQQVWHDEVCGVVEFLAQLPTPQAVLQLRPSEQVVARVEELLAKKRAGTLLAQEVWEWQQYLFLERIVRLAKSHATYKNKPNLSEKF